MAVRQRTPQCGGMVSRHRSVLSAVVSSALVVALAGCSGPVTSDDPPPVPAATETPQPTNPSDTGPVADDTVPVLHFTAHGEGAPNTVGPSCSWGIERGSSNLFRVTAPESWVMRGSSGGSGPSDIRYEVGGSDVMVDLVESRGDECERQLRPCGLSGQPTRSSLPTKPQSQPRGARSVVDGSPKRTWTLGR